MFIKYFKLILIISFFYQSPLYSKSIALNNFNSHNFSNYLSGIIAYENKDNSEALDFFKSSKFLIGKHEPYFERYIYSLVLENNVKEAAKEIKKNLDKNNSNFFEAFLILSLDSLKKKDFSESKGYLVQASEHINNDRYAAIIYETLNQYLHLFKENEILETKKNFGNLSMITEVFQRCYLDDINIQKYFNILLDKNDGDYSRYIFFNIHYLIKKKNLKKLN
jgi:hypothetical protein